MLGVLLALWSLLIMPFAFRISISLGDDFLPTGYLDIRTIGPSLRVNWTTIFTEKGLDIRLRYAGHEQKEKSMREIKGLSGVAVAKVLKDEAFRENLRSYIKRIHVTVNARIGLQDAAETALLCGLCAAIASCVPNAKANVIPDYQAAAFCVEIKCIAIFRMGKLFASAVVLLRAISKQYMRQKVGGVQHG